MLAISRVMRIPPVPSSRSFKGFSFTFRSTTHLEVICMRGMRQRVKFPFPFFSFNHSVLQMFWYLLLKRLSFFSFPLVTFKKKHQLTTGVGPLLGSLSCPVMHCLSLLHEHCAVLITTAGSRY